MNLREKDVNLDLNLNSDDERRVVLDPNDSKIFGSVCIPLILQPRGLLGTSSVVERHTAFHFLLLADTVVINFSPGIFVVLDMDMSMEPLVFKRKSAEK
jgi:hypothetical protein